jgi:hypothetical protein
MAIIKGQEASLLATILIAGTVIIGTGQISLADTVNRDNAGYDVPTNTNQHQVCKTNGNNSPESGSCTASSSNTLSQSGGTISSPEEGTQGPAGPAGTLPVQEYVTFNSCGGSNGNHNVQCSIHIEGTSASSLTCTVANPAISGGDNTGDCQTNTGLHLSCVIPPQPGPFLCSRLS